VFVTTLTYLFTRPWVCFVLLAEIDFSFGPSVNVKFTFIGISFEIPRVLFLFCLLDINGALSAWYLCAARNNCFRACVLHKYLSLSLAADYAKRASGGITHILELNSRIYAYL